MANSKNKNKSSIPYWSDADKPREKLIAHGAHQLSDAELLAIILGKGSKEKNAVDLARELLASYDNKVDTLAQLAITDLTSFKGIGQAKAISIIAALELGRRSQLTSSDKKLIITSSDKAFQVVRKQLANQQHEECWVLFLNRRNQLINMEQLSRGGVTGTVVDVRIILKKAVEKLATGIILCHNHPSGNLQPSSSDGQITRKLAAACDYLDVKLIDHLIVTSVGYYSFADEGKL